MGSCEACQAVQNGGMVAVKVVEGKTMCLACGVEVPKPPGGELFGISKQDLATSKMVGQFIEVINPSRGAVALIVHALINYLESTKEEGSNEESVFKLDIEEFIKRCKR